MIDRPELLRGALGVAAARFATHVHASGLREYVCAAIAVGPGSPPVPRAAN